MTGRNADGAVRENRRSVRIILLLAAGATPLYYLLAAVEPGKRPLAWLSLECALVATMLLAWRLLPSGRGALRVALVGALLFRIAAAPVGPMLSDDVYRYVWDGRVQLAGIHPYRHAPDDPALHGLRDADWSRINHPELKTVYPPLSQLLFVGLATLGAGPLGFKLALGLLDFGVVLALALLLERSRLPRDRLILYAWNPLAVIETAGNGHVEPLGVGLVLLSAVWILARLPGLSTLALAGGVLTKVLPVVLLPLQLRRTGPRQWALLAVALVLPFAAYAAWGGPAIGPGLADYAERWEHNSVCFAGLQQSMAWLDLAEPLKRGIAALQRTIGGDLVPWDFLYLHVWPRDTAKLLVALLALLWLVRLVREPRLDPARASFLALGGVLLLSPTLHPWYLLWVLPFAAAYLSWGWLVLAALVPLSYLAGSGEVSWSLRLLQYLPPLAVWLALRARRSPRVNMRS
jgi:hypothetical protein